MSLDETLSYDDILLVPKKSVLESRDKAILDANLCKYYWMRVPFVSSPMETVTNATVAVEMYKAGGVGILHRFCSIGDQIESFVNVAVAIPHHYEDAKKDQAVCALGVNDGYDRLEALYEVGCRTFCIDVAHGHSALVEKYMHGIPNKIRNMSQFIIGSIATKEAAIDCIEWGADALRVGIGNGSACSTRLATGFGVPQVGAIINVGEVAIPAGIPIIACGGIRSAGDAAKAIALGSSSVMLGSLIAACSNAPNPGYHAGAANRERYNEGSSGTLPVQGTVAELVKTLSEGLRSAISYAGGTHLHHLRECDIIKVAAGVQRESEVRLSTPSTVGSPMREGSQRKPWTFSEWSSLR